MRFDPYKIFDPLLAGRKGHPVLAQLRGWRYTHRGYHDKPQIPENSLAAFRRGVERGWGSEFDVHILKDGTLAVMHDSDLKRCTGVDGIIEDLDREALAKLRLEGTDEHVPLFDEVLDVYEGKAPLIIELKSHGGNHFELSEAVCKRLDSYKGVFCVESFDPRVVADIRRLRPDFCRGQLAENFLNGNNDLPGWQRFLLTNLLFNPATRPDFIAYKFDDRDNRRNRRCLQQLGLQGVNWTIRSKEDLLAAEAEGSLPIFEHFDPDE